MSYCQYCGAETSPTRGVCGVKLINGPDSDCPYDDNTKLSDEIAELNDAGATLLRRNKRLTAEIGQATALARRLWIQINGDDEFFEDALKAETTKGSGHTYTEKCMFCDTQIEVPAPMQYAVICAPCRDAVYQRMADDMAKEYLESETEHMRDRESVTEKDCDHSGKKYADGGIYKCECGAILSDSQTVTDKNNENES